MSKTEKLMDKLYENRVQLLKYFAVAAGCAVLRTIIDFLGVTAGVPSTLSEPFSFLVWAAAMLPLLKRFVFRYRAPEVFTLLTKIMIYIFCVFVLWVTRQLLVGGIYILCANAVIAASFGGALNEVLCALIMFRIVFRQKK